jgi:mxaJ protein
MSIVSSAGVGGCAAVTRVSVVAFTLLLQIVPGPQTVLAAEPLRICATANQLPYSAKDGSGFENKVGLAVASGMNRKAAFVFSDKPAIFLVRDFLDKKKCDVIIGLDSGDQRVLTTKPYYRASYVFVSRRDKNVNVSSWGDPAIKTLGHIVVDFGSPSEVMLRELGLYNDDMAYLYSLVGFRAPRNEYVQISPEKMVGELKSGSADLAVAFAPDIARYVKSDSSLVMVPVQDDTVHNKDERLPQQYDQSMAVRLGDTALLAELDAAIVKAKPKITAILAEEGIPLIESRK